MSDKSDSVDLAALAAEMFGLEPEQAKLATSVIASVIRMARATKAPLDPQEAPANARPGDGARRVYVWRPAWVREVSTKTWIELTHMERKEVLSDNPHMRLDQCENISWQSYSFTSGK